MGRYYEGDISGKFWFGVQSSYAGVRFGAEELEPTCIEFKVAYDGLTEVIEELDNIRDNLGTAFNAVEEFFENNESYNEAKLEQFFTTAEPDCKLTTKEILREYADYRFGVQILEALRNNKDDVYFTAET